MRVDVLISKGTNSLTHPWDPWDQWDPWDPWGQWGPWDPSGPWDPWGLDDGIICEKGGRGVIM